MPGRSTGAWGFTPINQPELAAPTQPVVTRNREARRGSAAHRPRKNPLIKEYLSPGKSAGPSMFERAAISHGEEPQLKKRKTTRASEGDKKQYGATGGQARPIPNTGGRRVVSEGMRASKPFASLPVKPQHPTFNPRSAADRFLTSRGVKGNHRRFVSGDTPSSLNSSMSQAGRSSAVNDNVSVVSPLTSMDIISAHSTSSFTLESISASQHTSCDSLQFHRTNNKCRQELTQSGAVNANAAPSHPSHSPSVSVSSQHGVNRQPRNSRLDTIVEEHEAEFPSPPLRINNEAAKHPEETSNFVSDDSDPFDDGISDIDLLLSVEVEDIELPQEDKRDISPSKLISSEQAVQSCPHQVDYSEMEQFFAEDWELSEDDDADLIEAEDRSINAATVLNRVFSNMQKVQATPIVVSSTGADAQNVRSPELKPIVRQPFPDDAAERSPILGLSSATSLRVCFRIGEALNVGMQAVRERRSVIIELYARVRWSFREPRSTKQHFTFMDLFHDRPPYLDGTYDGWKGVALYEHDSSRFLERPDRPLKCRCIGKLKRDGTSWRLTVASVWEASMDDVEHVLGVTQS